MIYEYQKPARMSNVRMSNPVVDACVRCEPSLMGASMLVGRSVHNHKGEDLGEVTEVMLDVRTGQVSYAVLSFGGFRDAFAAHAGHIGDEFLCHDQLVGGKPVEA